MPRHPPLGWITAENPTPPPARPPPSTPPPPPPPPRSASLALRPSSGPASKPAAASPQVRAGERLRRVKQLRNLFMLREGRWPSDGELAEAAEITEGQLQTALRSGLDTVSLEAQMPAGGASGRGSATLTDMLPAPEGCDPADALAARDLRALLKQSLAGLLDPRDAKMMELLYALDEGEGRRTAEEVGVLFSVSAREARAPPSQPMHPTPALPTTPPAPPLPLSAPARPPLLPPRSAALRTPQVRRIEAKCLRKLQDQRQLVVRLRTYLES